MSFFDQLLQFVIGGLTVGGLYALAGLGAMVVYNITRVVNFSQGEFVMLGGMLTATFYGLGLSTPIAILAAVACTVVVGMAMQRLVIHPARRASVLTLLLLTFGAGVVIRAAALLVWGTYPKSFPPFSGTEPVFILSAVVQPQALWVLGVGLLLALLFYVFFGYTITGKALRACAINPSAARTVGISPGTMALVAFALAAAFGALGGAVMTPWTPSSYSAGITVSIKGFVAALAGGLDRIEGVVLGAFALAILESVAAGFLSSAFKDGIALFVLVLILYFRPSGLLGGAGAGKV